MISKYNTNILRYMVIVLFILKFNYDGIVSYNKAAVILLHWGSRLGCLS